MDYRFIIQDICPRCEARGLERVDFAIYEDQTGSGSWYLARCVACSTSLYQHTRENNGQWQRCDDDQPQTQLTRAQSAAEELRQRIAKSEIADRPSLPQTSPG